MIQTKLPSNSLEEVSESHSSIWSCLARASSSDKCSRIVFACEEFSGLPWLIMPLLLEALVWSFWEFSISDWWIDSCNE